MRDISIEGNQKIKKGYKFKFLDQAWVIEEIFDNGLILIYLENNLRTRKIVTLSYFTDEILKESKDIKAANPSLAKYKKIEVKKQFHKLYAKMASSKIPDPVGAAAYITSFRARAMTCSMAPRGQKMETVWLDTVSITV